jgi:hypothetical protein
MYPNRRACHANARQDYPTIENDDRIVAGALTLVTAVDRSDRRGRMGLGVLRRLCKSSQSQG